MGSLQWIQQSRPRGAMACGEADPSTCCWSRCLSSSSCFSFSLSSSTWWTQSSLALRTESWSSWRFRSRSDCSSFLSLCSWKEKHHWEAGWSLAAWHCLSPSLRLVSAQTLISWAREMVQSTEYCLLGTMAWAQPQNSHKKAQWCTLCSQSWGGGDWQILELYSKASKPSLLGELPANETLSQIVCGIPPKNNSRLSSGLCQHAHMHAQQRMPTNLLHVLFSY